MSLTKKSTTTCFLANQHTSAQLSLCSHRTLKLQASSNTIDKQQVSGYERLVRLNMSNHCISRLVRRCRPVCPAPPSGSCMWEMWVHFHDLFERHLCIRFTEHCGLVLRPVKAMRSSGLDPWLWPRNSLFTRLTLLPGKLYRYVAHELFERVQIPQAKMYIWDQHSPDQSTAASASHHFLISGQNISSFLNSSRGSSIRDHSLPLPDTRLSFGVHQTRLRSLRLSSDLHLDASRNLHHNPKVYLDLPSL